MSDGVVRFKDFTLSAEPIKFRIGSDIFECAPEIPLDSLVEMAQLTAGDDRTAVIARFYDFFDGIMLPDSAAKFRRRGDRKSVV